MNLNQAMKKELTKALEKMYGPLEEVSSNTEDKLFSLLSDKWDEGSNSQELGLEAEQNQGVIEPNGPQQQHSESGLAEQHDVEPQGSLGGGSEEQHNVVVETSEQESRQLNQQSQTRKRKLSKDQDDVQSKYARFFDESKYTLDNVELESKIGSFRKKKEVKTTEIEKLIRKLEMVSEEDKYKVIQRLFWIVLEAGDNNGREAVWSAAQGLEIIKGLLEERDYYSIKCAINNKDIKSLEWVLEKSKRYDIQRQEMFKEGFTNAAAWNDVRALGKLLEEAEKEGLDLSSIFKVAFKDTVEWHGKPYKRNPWDSTIALNFLWEKAKSLGLLSKMSKAESFMAFGEAAYNGHVDVLEFLWKRAEGMQRLAMLKADNYGAFRSAARYGCINVLEFLWDAAMKLVMQHEMLKANDYEALAHIIKNPVSVSLLEKFKSSINEEFIVKESIVSSRFIQKITSREWKTCLEAVADSCDKEVLKLVWQNFIPPDRQKEVETTYQRLRQKFTRSKGLSEPRPGPSSEYEPPLKRSRVEREKLKKCHV